MQDDVGLGNGVDIPVACLGVAILLREHRLSDQRKQLRRTHNYLARAYRHLRDHVPLDVKQTRWLADLQHPLIQHANVSVCSMWNLVVALLRVRDSPDAELPHRRRGGDYGDPLTRERVERREKG